MKFEKYIACICEGSAEAAIIDILLDNRLLCFTREDLLDESVLRCRNAQTFETRYLRKEMNGKISVIRVLDSRRENFKLSNAYAAKVTVINVITAPEIEMLIILNEKPSTFCKENLKMHQVKSYDFVRNYFCNTSDLLYTIKRYAEISKQPKGEYTLLDLLSTN